MCGGARRHASHTLHPSRGDPISSTDAFDKSIQTSENKKHTAVRNSSTAPTHPPPKEPALELQSCQIRTRFRLPAHQKPGHKETAIKALIRQQQQQKHGAAVVLVAVIGAVRYLVAVAPERSKRMYVHTRRLPNQ